MERRIAAILAADMAGFSRLVELDETGTLARQKRHRIELIDPAIHRHNGQIIKLTGDGLLAEFASVVEAVQAAVHVQKQMVGREAEMPEDRRIRYRIAVHLGDVVFDDGDVYGDGVNVAARLEGLAEPGGVVVSGQVHDMLKAQVDVGYRALGEKRLKNISTPVRVYEVTEDSGGLPRQRWPRRSIGVAAAVGILALALAGWVWMQPDFAPVDPADMTLQLPQDPSIAVLPFVLRGDAGANAWVADGITESIIATLSLAPELVVMSRSTMLGYRNSDVSAGDVARDLGVRYVLSGSVQAVGDQLRVTAELADAIEGNVIWTLREDSRPDDLMALQDGIAERVFEEMSVALTEGEGGRIWIELAGGFENYVRIIDGRSEFQKFSPEGHVNAERIWGEMHRADPDVSFINYLMGYIHWQKIILGISKDPAFDLSEATRLAHRALDISEFGEVYTLLAVLEMLKRNHDAAIAYADKAIALSPGSADANSLAGLVKATSGQTAEGLKHMELGMRLEPDFPDWLPAPVNFARLKLGKYDDARKLAMTVIESEVQDVRAKPYAMALMTALEVFEGDMDAARYWAQQLLGIYPQASGANALEARQFYKDQEFVAKYVGALIAAGIPEE